MHAVLRHLPGNLVVVIPSGVQVPLIQREATGCDVEADSVPYSKTIRRDHVWQGDLVYAILLHRHGPVEPFPITDAESVVIEVDGLAIGINVNQLDDEIRVLSRRRDV